MTELQFLIDLLLNHKLPTATKKLIAERVGEVETALRNNPQRPQAVRPSATAQCASTQALLDKEPLVALPPPVEALIASPQAAQAMASRQQALAAATSGIPEKGLVRPRKF